MCSRNSFRRWSTRARTSVTNQEPRANSEILSTFPHLRLKNLNRLLLSSFGFWKNKYSVLRTAKSWRRERPQLSDFNSKLRVYLVRRHNANSDRSWAMALKRCTPAARGRRGRDGQSQTPHWGWRPVRQQRPRWRHSQLLKPLNRDSKLQENTWEC